MGNERRPLETALSVLLGELQRPDFLFMSQAQREPLIEKVRSIETKLNALRSTSLLIGILGGTGVGKSTLMNALAGAEIAHTSHRRPDTDAVLIYRHTSSDFQPPSTPGIRLKEIIHRVDSVKEIILCDLPDFDSLAKAHREQVVSFLDELDVVMWIVSPEKYADAKFYDLLGKTLKSKQNFIFVLNKTDLLFDGISPAAGEERLETLLGVFRKHLVSAGIERPTIFNVSARPSQIEAAAWNDLKSLRETVFRRRDEKQIMAIKAANLEAEFDGVIRIIGEMALALARFSDVIGGGLVKEVMKGKEHWLEAGSSLIEDWMKNHLAEWFHGTLTENLPLAGWPGRLFTFLGKGWIRRSLGTRVPAPLCQVEIPPDFSRRIENQIEFLENRLTNSLEVLDSLPERLKKELKDSLDFAGLALGLEARLKETATREVLLWPTSGHFLFRLFQKAAYLLLFLLFLTSIASPSSWQNFLETPALDNLLTAIFSSLRNIFSISGFAGLLSYTLISLFLGLRFFIRAKKLIYRDSDAVLGSVKKQLSIVWEDALGELERRLKEFAAKIDSEKRQAAEILASRG